MSTDAYLVVHRGVVVHKFGKVTQPMNLASVRKSVLSVLYGIGVDRGEIDLNKTMAELESRTRAVSRIARRRRPCASCCSPAPAFTTRRRMRRPA